MYMSKKARGRQREGKNNLSTLIYSLPSSIH